MLAEYLVGGLTAGRLRQLAARVVAVHQMVLGAEFPDVHQGLVDAGVPAVQAFTITMRVFRSGGLTKDAVYLRGLHELVDHVRHGTVARRRSGSARCRSTAVPLVEDLHRRGVLSDPLLVPATSTTPSRTRGSRASTRSTRSPRSSETTRMKIGFVINSIATEKPEYTTVRLALAATRKGHETWMMGVDDFSHRADGTVAAHARTASKTEVHVADRVPRQRPGSGPRTAKTSRSTTSTCS